MNVAEFIETLEKDRRERKNNARAHREEAQRQLNLNATNHAQEALLRSSCAEAEAWAFGITLHHANKLVDALPILILYLEEETLVQIVEDLKESLGHDHQEVTYIIEQIDFALQTLYNEILDYQ